MGHDVETAGGCRPDGRDFAPRRLFPREKKRTGKRRVVRDVHEWERRADCGGATRKKKKATTKNGRGAKERGARARPPCVSAVTEARRGARGGPPVLQSKERHREPRLGQKGSLQSQLLARFYRKTVQFEQAIDAPPTQKADRDAARKVGGRIARTPKAAAAMGKGLPYWGRAHIVGAATTQ